MALIFSWIELFRLSYFLNTFLNSGMALRITRTSPVPRKGMVKKKIHAIFPPMMKAIVKAKISISGARTATRIIII